MAQPKYNKKSPLHNYAYYSNMGIEMAVIIALGVFGGVKLDAWLHLSPLFTIILSLAGVGIAMYVMIKTISVSKKPKDEQNSTD